MVLLRNKEYDALIDDLCKLRKTNEDLGNVFADACDTYKNQLEEITSLRKELKELADRYSRAAQVDKVRVKMQRENTVLRKLVGMYHNQMMLAREYGICGICTENEEECGATCNFNWSCAEDADRLYKEWEELKC